LTRRPAFFGGAKVTPLRDHLASARVLEILQLP